MTENEARIIVGALNERQKKALIVLLKELLGETPEEEGASQAEHA